MGCVLIEEKKDTAVGVFRDDIWKYAILGNSWWMETPYLESDKPSITRAAPTLNPQTNDALYWLKTLVKFTFSL